MDWKDIDPEARVVLLPHETRPFWFVDYASIEERVMGKRIEKKIVPPRDERMEDLGKPKTPKMGGITPKKVELPEVDGLLDKMKQALPEMFEPPMWARFYTTDDYERDFRSRYLSDFEREFMIDPSEPKLSHCHINCQCLPCQQGRCSGCHVERLRHSGDTEAIREAMRQYRGATYE